MKKKLLNGNSLYLSQPYFLFIFASLLGPTLGIDLFIEEAVTSAPKESKSARSSLTGSVETFVTAGPANKSVTARPLTVGQGDMKRE